MKRHKQRPWNYLGEETSRFFSNTTNKNGKISSVTKTHQNPENRTPKRNAPRVVTPKIWLEPNLNSNLTWLAYFTCINSCNSSSKSHYKHYTKALHVYQMYEHRDCGELANFNFIGILQTLHWTVWAFFSEHSTLRMAYRSINQILWKSYIQQT